MQYPAQQPLGTCVIDAVQPLLTDLPEPVEAGYCGAGGRGRAELEQFVRRIFREAYGAELPALYPQLLAFRTAAALRGAVGFRDGMVKPLFSEQYLDAAAESVIAAHVGQAVARHELVEVGNLALAAPGEARWMIAATTAFLHAAGYRWVLFTAVRPLFNAFRRLGLKPIMLAAPDPARLPDRGRNWGSYYQAGPLVCAGDIAAGYHKLAHHLGAGRPRLQALLNEVRGLGLASRCAAGGLREAV